MDKFLEHRFNLLVMKHLQDLSFILGDFSNLFIILIVTDYIMMSSYVIKWNRNMGWKHLESI